VVVRVQSGPGQVGADRTAPQVCEAVPGAPLWPLGSRLPEPTTERLGGSGVQVAGDGQGTAVGRPGLHDDVPGTGHAADGAAEAMRHRLADAGVHGSSGHRPRRGCHVILPNWEAGVAHSTVRADRPGTPVGLTATTRRFFTITPSISFGRRAERVETWFAPIPGRY